MTSNSHFQCRGLYIFDVNISTKTIEICSKFQDFLGLDSCVLSLEKYCDFFENTNRTTVYDSFRRADIGSVYRVPLQTKDGKIWFKYEITCRYTDNTGYHHVSGIGRELTAKEISTSQINIDANIILSIINDLQTTPSDKLFTKGLRQVLKSVRTQMPDFNIGILQYNAPYIFDIIELAMSLNSNDLNDMVSTHSTIESAWIDRCCTLKRPMIIENADTSTEINDDEALFFKQNDFKSALIVPILLSTDVTWGVIGVTYKYPTTWSDKEINNIEILANSIATCIQRNQLNVSLNEQIRQQNLACQIGKITPWHWDCRKQQITSHTTTSDGELCTIYTSPETLYKRANTEDMNNFKEEMKLVTLGKKNSFNIVFRHRSITTDKEEWFDIAGEVINRDKNGVPIVIVGIARNIHEEKERELSKQAEWNSQNNIYNNLPVGIEFFDTSGKIIYSNATIEKLFGITNFFHDKPEYTLFNQGLWSEDKNELIRTNNNIDILTHIDFSKQPFLPHCQSGRDDVAYFTHKISKLFTHGKFMGYMCVTIDSTETLKQKEQIKLLESYISELGKFANVGILWNNNLSIYISEQWNTNLGLPTNYKPIDYKHDTINILSEDREIMDSQYNSIIEGKISTFQQDVRVTQLDDKIHWIRFFFARNEKNELTALSVDITQRKQNEKLLIKAKRKAERMDMLKSDFINNMSHEIRTPLNAIIGFSELLVMAETEEERNLHAEIINTNNEYLLSLISDILDFSKLESNNMDYKYENVNIGKLFNTIYNNNIHKCPSNISFNIIECTDEVFTFVDPKRLEQMMTNMISNAFKFTTKGSVDIWWEHDEKEMSFHVKDTGMGIAEKDISRIFDSFVKLDNFTIGTGLGLSICNTLSQQMGGNIQVETAQGEGAHFWITLPILTEEEYNTNKQNLLRRRQLKTTFIVSNDQDTLDFISFCFDDDYDTMRYTRTEGFFPMWIEKKPKVTILDIRLFGYNIVEYLPGLRHHSKDNIIVLNNHQSGISNDTLINAGANKVVMMPASIEEIRNAIKLR